MYLLYGACLGFGIELMSISLYRANGPHFEERISCFALPQLKGKISFIMAQMAPLYNCKHVLIVKRVALAVCHQGVCSGEAV